jgi:hypothetical protein
VKTEDPFKDNSWRNVRYCPRDGLRDIVARFDNKLESLIFQAGIGADREALFVRGEVIVRHRMSKEIAEELLRGMGNSAFVHCLERIENNTKNPQLWRDVLAWMGELNGDD